MQAELNSDVALAAANALLSHLRKNPGAAMLPARELADMFGLEEAFVGQVIHGLQQQRRPEVRQASYKQGPFQGLGESIQRVWMRATQKPILFVAVTLAACIALSFGCSFLTSLLWPATKASPAQGFSGSALGVLLTILILTGTTWLLHMAVYFRHRSAKNALYGGLIVFGAFEALLGLAFLGGRAKGPAGPSMAFLFVMGSMAMLMLSLIYYGMGSLSALLGGWARFKMQERADETMTRQEMLERYFELESRLQKSAYPRPTSQAPAILSWPSVAVYRRFQFPINIAVGFVLSILGIFVVNASGITPGEQPAQVNFWFIVLILLSIVPFLIHILQGYLSKASWRAAIGSLCLAIGTAAARFLPISDIGRDPRATDFIITEGADALMMMLVSCAGYLGAVVQTRAIRESNLQKNDQATLLTEMVRIQWKLSNAAAAICVMVVDAAKSSEMKAAADPLVVEYTFREYQEWLEAISVPRGGRVHSTAGDGAVVAFNTCALALSAAKKIQTDVYQFNKDVNRLAQPFRLRIGLHTGEVVGDINQVQFTEVIDIAAHIESACPIGGIAVTDDVSQRLPDEQFIDLGMQVDGHGVFMVANPTEFH